MYYCCIPDCESKSDDLRPHDQQLCAEHNCVLYSDGCTCPPACVIFSFPPEDNDADRRRKWIEFVQKAVPETTKDSLVNPSCGICSKHFVDKKPSDTNPYPSVYISSLKDASEDDAKDVLHASKKRKISCGDAAAGDRGIVSDENRSTSPEFKAESVSVSQDTPDSLPHKTPRRGRPPGKRTASHATPPKSEDLPVVGEANTESTSDRTGRRNKCTSAAVLLGLVKSRTKKNATSNQQSSSSEIGPTSQRSQSSGAANQPKKSEARAADQQSKAACSDVKLSVIRLSESELNSSAVSSPLAAHSLSATNSASSLGSPASSSTPSSVRIKKRDNLIVNPDWLKPFNEGWRREVVHRGVSLTSKPTADVYYFTPQNAKLRSLPEVTDYLIRTKSPLPATYFTFIKEPIYQEPEEVVRLAGLSRGARGPRKSASGADLSSIHSSGSASPVPSEAILKHKKPRIRSKTAAVDETESSLKSHLLSSGTSLASPSTDIDTPGSSAGKVLLPSKGRGRPKLTDNSQAIVSAAKSLLKHRWGSAVSPAKSHGTGMLLKVKLPSISLKKDVQNAAAAAAAAAVSPAPAAVATSKDSPSKKSSPMLDRRRKQNIAEKHDVVYIVDDDLDLEEVLEREIAAKPSEQKDSSRITIRTKPSAVSSPSTVVVIRPGAGQPVKPKLSTSVVGGKTMTTISLKSGAAAKAVGTSPVVRLQTAAKGSTNQMAARSPLVLVSQIKSRTGDLTVKSMLEQKRSGGDVTSFAQVTNTENVTKKTVAADGSVKTPATVNVEQKICGLECPGRQGIPPSLHCDMCMTLFHPQCVGLYSHFGWLNGFTCWSCRHLCRQLQSTKYRLNSVPVAAAVTTTTAATATSPSAASASKASSASSTTHHKSPTAASSTASSTTSTAVTTAATATAAATATTAVTPAVAAAAAAAAASEATSVKCTVISGIETAVTAVDTVIDVDAPVVSSSQLLAVVTTSCSAALPATSSLSPKVITVSDESSSVDVIDSLTFSPLVPVAANKESKDSALQEAGPSSLTDDKQSKAATKLPVSTSDIPCSVPETSAVSAALSSSPAPTSTTASATVTASTSSVTSVVASTSPPTLASSGLYLDQSSRQILTLPLGILSHIDMSLPLMLVAGGRCIEMKRDCVLTTDTALRIFLPAACLPNDYVNGSNRPLVAQVLPRSADRPAQMIAVALMGEDPFKALELLDAARAAAAKAEAAVKATEAVVASTDAGDKVKSAGECESQADDTMDSSQLATDVSAEAKLTDASNRSTAAAAVDANDDIMSTVAAGDVETHETDCTKPAEDHNLATSTNTEVFELNTDNDVEMTEERPRDTVDVKSVECSDSLPAESTVKPVSPLAAVAGEDETSMQT